MTSTTDSDVIDERIVVRSASQAMRQSYLDYALQVIRARALPDIRDGLKPVHRRILFAMFESGFTSDKPFRKSARAVGDVMGKYHPHGDKSIYDAMVIMAQSWSTNVMLLEPQGNFGNIDGDAAAAMRYTEARLSPSSMLFFDDIAKDTVAWQSNYDETENEPTVLPAPYPNLVANGSSGIAVGIATNIVPHNLRETIAATKLLIDDPDTATRDLCGVMKGPDFPTMGIVHGLDGFVSAMETGAGRIHNRAKYTIESRGNKAEAIVVTEIPYLVKKSQILLQIRDLVVNKEIDGIIDLADESDKHGMRIWIAIRRDESAEAIMAQLFKRTSLEVSHSYNCTVIQDDRPVKVGLRHLMLAWIAFRREVVHARTVFARKKALERHHIYDGFRKAIDRMDDVIALVRAASDTATARQDLIALLAISEVQAQEILGLRLSRLTGMEIQQIVDELRDLEAKIADLGNIIETPARIDGIIKTELDAIAIRFGRSRQSEIAHGLSSITPADMVPREDVVIMMTEGGYIKRLPTSSIQAQNRGTRGKSGITVGEGDRITFLKECHSHDLIMAITESGQALGIAAYQVPETPANSRGRHVRNVIAGIDESILTILKLPELTDEQRADNDDERGALYSVVSVSRLGQVRRTPIADFGGITRGGGVRGLKFGEGDGYAACFVMHRDDHLLLTNSNGKTIRFPITAVNCQSRVGTGVAGIKVTSGDRVVGASVIDGGTNEGNSVIIVSENGYGKRTPVSEFEPQGRGGQGNYLLRPHTRRIAALLKSEVVRDDQDILFMTRNGINNRLAVERLQTVSRIAASGVKMLALDADDALVDFAIVARENDADEVSNTEG